MSPTQPSGAQRRSVVIYGTMWGSKIFLCLSCNYCTPYGALYVGGAHHKVVHNVGLTNPGGQTDRCKVMHMIPLCKLHRWAKKLEADFSGILRWD